MPRPRPPIVLDEVLDEPGRFWSLVASNGPFPSLQRKVMQSAVESAAITGEWATPEMEAESRAGGARSIEVSPSFRSHWLQGGRALRDGVEWLAVHEPFLDAARRLVDGVVVRPDEVYVNAQVPAPARPRSSHLDIPKFRGLGRREHPVWLLTTMRRSGLFDRWRIPVATAVCWFYDGPGGTYTYWPDGPDAPPRRTSHPFTNTAVVGENDTMFHRGDGTGEPGSVAPVGLSLDSELRPVDESTWAVCDGEDELARYTTRQVRFALSWSAEVFVDDEARRVADEHLDDLDLATVLDAFVADLHERHVDVELPDDPLHDVGFVATLARAYRVVPRFNSPDEVARQR